MSLEAWFTLGVISLTLAALVSERVSPPAAVFGATTVLLVTGVIDASQALSGFANPAPFTVAALYVLAAAVEKTGVLEQLTFRIGTGAAGPRRTLARLLLPTAAASSFLNNTPIVAMVAPAVRKWTRRTGGAASLYLMPVSFAAILGGVVTLIGTSTNLVVSGLLQAAGERPLGLFEIGRVGLPLALVGIAYLICFAPILLPRRRGPAGQLDADAREFTVEMVISPGSALIGRSVTAGGLRNLEGVFLIEVERGGRRMAPVSPEETLVAGDRLTFAGNVGRVVDLHRIPGLTSAEERHFPDANPGPRRRFYEAVVAEGSSLAGSTLKNIGFRSRYGGAVVAIHRAGERIVAKLGEVTLKAGDLLLVLGGDDFRRRWRESRDFLVVAPIATEPLPHRERAWLVALITGALFLVVGTGMMDILPASLLTAVALVTCRALTTLEARQAVDVNVIVIIAASFGVAAAISASGLAGSLARSLIAPLGHFGEIGLLLGVLLATMVLTELITNNAAAVLMFPIAMATAQQAGLDPRPFAIVVAVGGSSSFLSPIGYQTNTMVYGMGGYRFADFVRLGLPLTVLVCIIVAILVPAVWPLRS